MRLRRSLFLSLTCLTLFGCKHSRQRSQLKEQYGAAALDALVLTDDLVNAPKNCRIDLINLTLDSVSEGLLRNGALTGLGTDNPVGKKMKTDGAYYQGLRIASIFDWEFSQRITAKEPACLPEHVGFQLGTFPLAYNERLGRPFPDDVRKIKAAALKVNKSLGQFDVLSVNAREQIQAWPKASSYPPEHQAALLSGVKTKLAFANDSSIQNRDELLKMKGFLASSSPLTVGYQAQFQRGGQKTYLEAHLPPFFQVEDSNLDDLSRWTLVRGIKKRKLSKPVQISVATLTHIGYIPEQDPESQPIIKVQMFKDLGKPDEIKTRIIFGRLSDKPTENGTLPIDYRNYKDSFYISFYPNVEIKPDDNSTIKSLKQQFNDVAGQIRVDARIHQLTLNLRRNPLPNTNSPKDLMLAPKFSLKDSDISFRLHRSTADEGERKSLRGVGFVCQEQAGQSEQDCYIDFGAYTDLRDFVLKGDQGVADGRLSTRIANAFKSVLNSVTRYNVKFIVDWNLPEIEAAVDKEFESIFNDLVDEQVKLRDKIQARVEQRLFDAE